MLKLLKSFSPYKQNGNSLLSLSECSLKTTSKPSQFFNTLENNSFKEVSCLQMQDVFSDIGIGQGDLIRQYRDFNITSYQSDKILPLNNFILQSEVDLFLLKRLVISSKSNYDLSNVEQAVLCSLLECNLENRDPTFMNSLYLITNYTRNNKEIFKCIGEWLNKREEIPLKQFDKFLLLFCRLDCHNINRSDEFSPWIKIFTKKADLEVVRTIAQEVDMRLYRGNQSLYDHLVVTLKRSPHPYVNRFITSLKVISTYSPEEYHLPDELKTIRTPHNRAREIIARENFKRLLDEVNA